MKALTKEEGQVVARRIFEALCEHYPDRYIALVEQPGNAGRIHRCSRHKRDHRFRYGSGLVG